MDKYTPEREIDSTFMSTVGSWIRATGEVLVLLRYLRAAGAKDFALCRSEAEFEQLVADAPEGTDVVAFREPQLPLRGTADDKFAQAVMRAVPNGTEWLLVSLARRSESPLCERSAFDNSHASLHEELGEIWGQEAAAGLCPNWVIADNDSLISRSKGGIVGPR